MSIDYVCDGCGVRGAGYWRPTDPDDEDERWHDGEWFKPKHWFEREDDDGQQHACSRECVRKIAAATGKTGLVLPI